MIRLGYVSLNTELPTASKTFKFSNYTEELMLSVARKNIFALKEILNWNLEHKIYLFRITSKLIPFGSSFVNSGSWKHILKDDLMSIGKFITENGMRVSMHPGQYTVINTPDKNYYLNSLKDLGYHNDVLSLMGLDYSHRIIIHGGGAYGDKKKSTELLKNRILKINPSIFNRIALENDDRVFNAKEVLQIAEELSIPAVLDLFHHRVYPSLEGDSREIILKFKPTWKNSERQKIHYSNQDISKKRPGAHSLSIDIKEFMMLYKDIKDLDLDIMLEVKDKEKSLLKIRSLDQTIG